MCWFVTAIVAAKSAPAFRAAAHRLGLETSAQKNYSIVGAIGALDRMPRLPELWSVTRGGCSCDLVRGAAGQSVALRDDLRELIATVAELSEPVAFVIHTYRGGLDEKFAVAKGPRLTPTEVRSRDALFPWDSVCVARVIPQVADRGS